MAGELGTTCGIGPYSWFGQADEEPPGVGDFLRTRTGTCYLITAARTIGGNRRRFMFECTRLGKDAVQLDEPGVYSLRWDSRARRT